MIIITSCYRPDINQLNEVVKNNDVDSVERLIEKKVPLYSEEVRENPLALAVQSGNIEIVRLLIDAGADVNQKTYEGTPVIKIAAKEKNWDIVKLLYENGASVDFYMEPSEELHFFTWLVQEKEEGMLYYFIEKGTFINYITSDKYSTFDRMIIYSSPELIDFLLSNIAIKEYSNKEGANGFPPLQTALHSDFYNKAEIILKHYPDLLEGDDILSEIMSNLSFNQRDDIALKHALEFCDNLIQTGRINPKKSRALHVTVYCDQYELVLWLIEHGVDPDFPMTLPSGEVVLPIDRRYGPPSKIIPYNENRIKINALLKAHMDGKY